MVIIRNTERSEERPSEDCNYDLTFLMWNKKREEN